jgi:flagellar capping protein FliD
MDKKEFIKNTKQGCRFFGKNASVRKECEKVSMCSWDKCQQEVIDIHNARLTDEDRKSCQNKDYVKEANCNEKLTKKKGLFDKIAMGEHCDANKCPQVNEFRKKITKQMVKSLKSKRNSKSKFADIDDCLNKNCSKEQEDIDTQDKQADAKRYECTKAYKTWKEQHACNIPSWKQSHKSRLKLYKCRDKHCDAKKSN